MILRAFLLALGQLGDRRFRRVVLLGIALSVALLIAMCGGILALIDLAMPGALTLPGIGEVTWVDDFLSWGSVAVVLGLSVFLMVPVAAIFMGLFLEDVAAAVEDRHYPGLPPVPRMSWGDSLIASVNFIGLIILVNIMALVIYPFAGPFAPFVFWAVNGFLIGREYFGLAAMRRFGREGARKLLQNNRGRVWIAGCLMAAPLSLPLVNLAIPVLGAATFTHLVNAMARAAPPRQSV